ncbi:MAG: FAD-binding oxidoreductase, partial [Patescibacteria group bacterium]
SPIFPDDAHRQDIADDKKGVVYDAVSWGQEGGVINDVSCLNKTAVFGIVRVHDQKDIQNAVQFAQERGHKISVAGAKHSMGGHAFYRDAVVLDMKGFNKMIVHEDTKTLTVESGATWHDIQSVIHPRFAIKAMQSSDIFTVGGSISVNAHGMDHHAGSVAESIRAMRVLLPDGSIVETSKTLRPELFRLVLGGYGLFGIVLDADIELVDNAVYERERRIISYKDFPKLFDEEIRDDKALGLFYGHLSTSPGSFLDEMIIYGYRTVDPEGTTIPPLGDVENVKSRRLLLNLAKRSSLAMRFKWFGEKYIEPRLEGCTVSRNQAMKEGEACLVSRNEPMHDSVKYLENNLEDETDILHEYFIPRDQFVTFVDGMRDILVKHNTVLLNASVRVVHKEDIALNYAPQDMFSIVLYINQKTTSEGNEKMQKVTGELVELSMKVGGRFFLPYQPYYTGEQLARGYPTIKSFFELKKKYDPNLLLMNKFYAKYTKELGVE